MNRAKGSGETVKQLIVLFCDFTHNFKDYHPLRFNHSQYHLAIA